MDETRDAPRAHAEAPARPAARRRMSRGKVRLLAWSAAMASFLLPWVAIRGAGAIAGTVAAPASGQQVVVVPAGSTVTITKPPNGPSPKVVVLTTNKGSAATPSTPAVATTSGSAPPP